MKKLYVLIAAFAIIMGLMMNPSCTKDYTVPEVIEIPDSVSFSLNVIPIFEEDCALSGCHVPGGQTPDLTPASAFNELWLYSLVDTADPSSSEVYVRMSSTSKPMPPSGNEPVGEQQLVLKWIEQGALDN